MIDPFLVRQRTNQTILSLFSSTYEEQPGEGVPIPSSGVPSRKNIPKQLKLALAPPLFLCQLKAKINKRVISAACQV